MTVDGNEIPFSSLQKLYMAIQQLTIRIILQLEAEHKQQRRKLLKKERDQEYRNCIVEFVEKKKMISATVKSRVLEAFEISHREYDSTYKRFYEQPQYSKVLSNLD